MTKQASDIEDSLLLCKEMGAPSVVIPVSKIEHYFPAKKHPSNPHLPSYNLGELREWAKAKGWAVSFATTGTTNDKRMVPGLRFTPLLEENSVHDPAAKRPINEPNRVDYWHNRPFGSIALKIILPVVVALVLYFIFHFFGLSA